METTSLSRECVKARARAYYLKMKSDPVRWAHYKKRCSVNTAKWYQKLKRNFPKYEEMLRKQNENLRLYRMRRSKKFLAYLERRRVKREMDPFHFRALHKKSYDKMRRDPVRYRKYLDRCLNWYYTMKKDSKRYRAYLENSKVYQRYYHIVRKAKAQEEAA